MNENLRWEIFRTGDFGDKGKYSEADVDELMETFDPKYFEPPVVLGHPEHDDPAYGRAFKLEKAPNADGGKSLFAHVRGVPDSLRKAIKSGAYNDVSIRMGRYRNWRNGSKRALRHIGLQGANAPVIKGMQALAFSEGLGCSTFAEGGFEEIDLTGVVPCDIKAMFTSGGTEEPNRKEPIMGETVQLDEKSTKGLIDGFKEVFSEALKTLIGQKKEDDKKLEDKNLAEPDPRDVEIQKLKDEKTDAKAKEIADKMFADGKIFKTMIPATVVALKALAEPEKMEKFSEEQAALDAELFKRVAIDQDPEEKGKSNADKVFAEEPEIKDSIEFLVQSGTPRKEAEALVRTEFNTLFAEGFYKEEK